MWHKITGGLAFFVLAIIAVFALQNLEPVEFSFLGWSTSVSKIAVILGTYVLGMLTGWRMVSLIKNRFKKQDRAPAEK
ncbi:hypothetical protein NHH03_22195 [Stieleria sp. TO1_6]|uniref:hypothetical protein n=1 Tax=Stieleria tagensis TaxID=2956795 RepID=UPI00209B700F|nr:hypothetical protein [Stieleria tagensis]MCO8124467.1 hypothetical protein [Stieleria tagensis]